MMKMMSSVAAAPWGGWKFGGLKLAGLRVVACSHPACGRWLTERHLASRRVGVRLQERWYCSFGCLMEAATERFKSLLTPTTVAATRAERMPLGLILISRGLLTHEQLRMANEEQKETGEEIGEAFVRLGFLAEKQVTSARAMQWGCPVFAAPARAAALQVHVPPTLMRLHSMVPLHYVAATNSLLVGFVHAIEYGALYAVEQVTGCRTQPCFVVPSDLQLQMRRLEQSNAAVPDELTFESAQSAEKMARILCDYGMLLNADEAVTGRAGEYVWARLKSGSKATDLLMKAP